MGHTRVEQVATGGVHDTLGFARRAGGVEDEERIFRVHRFRRAVRGDVGGGHLVFEPHVAAFGPRDRHAGVLDHDAGLDVGALKKGGVAVGLESGGLTTAQAGVAGDHNGGAGVEDTVAQGVSRETTEHDAMDGADARAGQHSDGEGGDHRQVDDHPVAFFDALLLEDVGELGDLLPEILVGDGLGGFRGVAFEVVSDGVAFTGFDVTVEAVVRNVQFAAFEPTDLRVLEVVVLNVVPLLDPGETFFRFLAPEVVGVVQGPPIHFLVLLHAGDPGVFLELGRNVEYLFDGFVCHQFPSARLVVILTGSPGERPLKKESSATGIPGRRFASSSVAPV